MIKQIEKSEIMCPICSKVKMTLCKHNNSYYLKGDIN